MGALSEDHLAVGAERELPRIRDGSRGHLRELPAIDEDLPGPATPLRVGFALPLTVGGEGGTALPDTHVEPRCDHTASSQTSEPRISEPSGAALRVRGLSMVTVSL